jgi:hypothetical protein
VTSSTRTRNHTTRPLAHTEAIFCENVLGVLTSNGQSEKSYISIQQDHPLKREVSVGVRMTTRNNRITMKTMHRPYSTGDQLTCTTVLFARFFFTFLRLLLPFWFSLCRSALQRETLMVDHPIIRVSQNIFQPDDHVNGIGRWWLFFLCMRWQRNYSFVSMSRSQ